MIRPTTSTIQTCRREHGATCCIVCPDRPPDLRHARRLAADYGHLRAGRLARARLAQLAGHRIALGRRLDADRLRGDCRGSIRRVWTLEAVAPGPAVLAP